MSANLGWIQRQLLRGSSTAFLVTLLHDHGEHLEHLHPRLLDLGTPDVLWEQDRPHGVTKDRAHDVEVSGGHLAPPMEQAQGPEALIHHLQVVNIGHQLMNHIHHQPGVILKKVMEVLLIGQVQLRWTDI